MKIAHTADLHIRFGSRHQEYREVFERFYEDLRKEKPDRIFVGGDLNHHKINMSPNSFDLSAEFLINLSKIAPTDVILGNHDINLQQLEQGDSISPIFKTANLLAENSDDQKAFMVTKENKESINYWKNAIYYYPETDFYDIGKNIVYGVYSCKDNGLLTLEKKAPEKTYIAFYHGPVYGCRGDNGYEMKGDKLMRLSIFNNFDIVMMGDIHEYQTFRDDETVIYPGSLIQQNYSENPRKGYAMWSVEERAHQFRHILNDYGFAKLNISKGEIIEERIANIQFSNNKKKTKVHIVWEDYEENYSLERENQIKHLVKDKYGCEVVKVEFKGIEKDNSLLLNEEQQKSDNPPFLQLLADYIKQNDFDCDESLLKEILEFAHEVDKSLEIEEDKENLKKEWELESMEVSNLFSFGETPVFFDCNVMDGITGIFGKNYNGKSNVIKALVWGLYQYVLGKGNSKDLINLYTESNKGFCKIYIKINGERYFIDRRVNKRAKKDGSIENSYSVDYKKLVLTTDEDGNEQEVWMNEISDRGAAEKSEVKKMVIDAIGTYDDFTKVSLQNQDGKDDYISQEQQPKNNLINRYLGLHHYRERDDYAGKYFNDVKKSQKDLGDCVELENKVKGLNEEIEQKNATLKVLQEEKRQTEEKREGIDKEILENTKLLEKIETLPINDIEVIKQKLLQEKDLLGKDTEEQVLIQDWLNTNFKKELPFDENLDINKVNSSLLAETNAFQREKTEYVDAKKWIDENPKKEVVSTDWVEKEIDDIKKEILNQENQLPVYRGKKCPTCNHVQKEANPEMEKSCLDIISQKKIELKSKQDIVLQSKNVLDHNRNFDVKSSKLIGLEATLKSRKGTIETLKQQKELFAKSADIITHNKEVETKTKRLDVLRSAVENRNKTIEKLTDNGVKLKENAGKIIKNKEINEKVSELQELVKAYKLTIYNLDKDITTINGDIRVLQNNLQNFTERLNQVKGIERLYKKYSIYVQAVHRDGIPAQIIRRKIPIINNKINSVLQDLVNFKVEMEVLTNGDIVEYFYYSPDKSDALPLTSASGAQKFVITLAIKDALHYISNLTKPSLSIIDEGFGKLDNELIAEIVTALYYLKNKYKNVWVITHRNEVKDFVDNTIEVSKNQDGIPPEILEKNPYAGVSIFNFS